MANLIHGDIQCPRHGGRFDVRTGAVTALPPMFPIKTYAVQLEGDQILVALRVVPSNGPCEQARPVVARGHGQSIAAERQGLPGRGGVREEHASMPVSATTTVSDTGNPPRSGM